MYAFFIFRESDDALVGGITLNNVRRGVAQTGTVGYWSGQPYVRQGHTQTALRDETRFAVGPPALQRLDAGNYGFICNIYDKAEKGAHYQEGMRVAFTVE